MRSDVLEVNMRQPDAELGVDLNELAAGDETASGGQLDRFASVPAEFDHVSGLEVGGPAKRQVRSAQLSHERARDVPALCRALLWCCGVHGDGLTRPGRMAQGSDHFQPASAGEWLGSRFDMVTAPASG